MATYNGSAYLGEQLASILHQTRQPDELVVGDDGSDDNTVGILRSFAEEAPFPVKLLQHDHFGFGTNFLLTLEESQGELVAFADQDDVWRPSKLERSEGILQHYDAVLVTHGATTVDHTLQPMRTGHRDVRRMMVYDRFQPNVWPEAWPGHHGNSMLFRRELLDGCDWRRRPTNVVGEKLSHDQLVYILASIRGASVYLPDKLLLYRQHHHNAGGARPRLVERWRVYAKEDASLLASLEGDTRRLNDWATYFSSLVEPQYRHATEGYFLGAAAVLAQRGERLRLPFGRAVPALMSAAIRGHYARLAPDGLGWGTLPRDFYHICRRRLVRQ